ncbi:MAG: hypothetical protein PHS74_05610 [Lachnospiraceae bacterium]|nr:hypothetical protein [Lachnospiraceae bacterium]
MDFFNEASNAVIENIRSERQSSFVTITYTTNQGCCNNQQTVTLIVTDQTIIRDEQNRIVSARELEKGMVIDALFSSAMTRSIPPQAQAFHIRIVSRPATRDVSEGRIIQIDTRNQFIVTINDNLSSRIRFNITPDTIIRDFFGRRIELRNLALGLKVRVEHANFMTASIPPQTTAYVIQVIR